MDVPDGFEQIGGSPFGDRIGPLYIATRDSMPVVGVRIEPHHTNRRGRVHGGLLTTVADIAVSRVAHTELPPGGSVATADLHISFLGNVNVGAWVEAVPSVDRVGRSLIHASCQVQSNGQVVAKVLATIAVRLPEIGP